MRLAEKLDWKGLRKKMGAQNIVKEIKQYQEKWLQHVQRMDTNRIPNKGYNINQKDEERWEDRERDRGTNFILRIKEQETRLILHEHDDDDTSFRHCV
jgi:hypothetical protein